MNTGNYKELLKGMFLREETNEQLVLVKKKLQTSGLDYSMFNVSNIGDYSTPKSLTDEIVFHIDVIEGGSYLDVSVGADANFICSLLEKNKNINIFIADISIINLILAKKKVYNEFGYDIPDSRIFLYKNITEFKKGMNDMKFDGIVGNPPFGDSSNESTYTNLWAQIYADCFKYRLKDNGQQGLVKPKTWATPKDENRTSQTSDVLDIIKEYATHINIDDCKKHFIDAGSKPGSTFSYTIVTKTKNKSSNAEVTTPDNQFDVDPAVFCKNIIVDINEISLSIFKKFRKLKMLKKEKGCSLKAEMISSDELNESNKKEFCYPVQYAMTTVKWANAPHILQNEKKVIFPNQNTKNYPLYDSGEYAPANRGAVFIVKSDLEGKNIVEFCKTKLMNFIISQQRFHHGLLNTAVVSNIPDIDYTKTWKDDDVYTLLDLTKEEINYIETYIR